MSHTYALLDVSPECYAEVRALLVLALYQHTLHQDREGDRTHEVIDMHGIALRSDPHWKHDAEREQRLTRLMDEAFAAANHPAMLDWVGVMFELRRLRRIEAGVRAHRDARGDDRCWRDDEALYALLPEGYTPRPRDTAVELEACRRYIASRENPGTVYVSPERELEMYRAMHERLCATVACSSPDGSAELAQVEQAYAERARLPHALTVLFYVLMRDADLTSAAVRAAVEQHVKPTAGMEPRFSSSPRQALAEDLAELFQRALARLID